MSDLAKEQAKKEAQESEKAQAFIDFMKRWGGENFKKALQEGKYDALKMVDTQIEECRAKLHNINLDNKLQNKPEAQELIKALKESEQKLDYFIQLIFKQNKTETNKLCRKLSLVFHPDKTVDWPKEEKEAAEAIFKLIRAILDAVIDER